MADEETETPKAGYAFFAPGFAPQPPYSSSKAALPTGSSAPAINRISLVPRSRSRPSGLLIRSSIKYIADDPPPSILYASVAPSETNISASSSSVSPRLYPLLRPSATMKMKWFASISPIPVRGFAFSIVRFPKFVSIQVFEKSVPATPSSTSAGPNDSVLTTP